MTMWLKYSLWIIAILVFLILLIKFMTRNNAYSDLDSRINGVRNGWDKVCAKIKHMVGC
jgi:hypothetical protein